jgi:hypothetical protein
MDINATTACLPRTYYVLPSKRGTGFTTFRDGDYIGTAATEHDARILASDDCYDQAVLKGKTLVVSPVEMLGGSVITMVRAYCASPRTTKPAWVAVRRVRITLGEGEDGWVEYLNSGEYYVCHGVVPLTYRAAVLSFYPTFKVGDRKGLFTVADVSLGEDGVPQLAALTVECDCGHRRTVGSRDFSPIYYRCSATCPAHKALRDRGSKVDEYGVIVDKDGLPEDMDPAKRLVVAIEPVRTVLDDMPPRDAPYSEWEAYHAGVARKEGSRKARQDAAAAKERSRVESLRWELGSDEDI